MDESGSEIVRRPSLKSSRNALWARQLVPMINERWIVKLLARCETAAGLELRQIRRNLSSDEWLSAIWELILLDAALALGLAKYENPAPGRGHPHLLIDSPSGGRL